MLQDATTYSQKANQLNAAKNTGQNSQRNSALRRRKITHKKAYPCHGKEDDA